MREYLESATLRAPEMFVGFGAIVIGAGGRYPNAECGRFVL